LVDCIEQYFTIQQFMEPNNNQKFYLAKAYQTRRLHKFHEQTINEISEFQKKVPLRNYNYYYNQYLLLEGQQKILTAQKSRADKYLESIAEHLDIAYLIEKLRHACDMVNFKQLYGSTYNVALLNEIEDYLAQNPAFLEVPAVSIYYYCYLALKNPNDEHNFSILRQLFADHSEKFAASEILDLYIFTLNHYVRKSNQGIGNPTIVFEMYLLGVEKGVFFINKMLSHTTFFNVVRSALQVNQDQWARIFIENNRAALEKKYQDNMPALCLANIEYQSGASEKVIHLLHAISFKEPVLSLTTKTLLLKVFYELSEFNVLDSQIQSMKKYIQTKRVLGYHKTNYLNITIYMRKLLNLNPGDRVAAEKLRESIMAEQSLTERPWFLKQLNRFL
jgi:hypothetical protein